MLRPPVQQLNPTIASNSFLGPSNYINSAFLLITEIRLTTTTSTTTTTTTAAPSTTSTVKSSTLRTTKTTRRKVHTQSISSTTAYTTSLELTEDFELEQMEFATDFPGSNSLFYPGVESYQHHINYINSQSPFHEKFRLHWVSVSLLFLYEIS